MNFELDTAHAGYFSVTISGLIVKTELIPLMAEILQHPEYESKHTFFDLREADMGLSIGDLKEIIGILRLYRPRKKNFADKSALLVSGKLHSAIADMFVTMTGLLPVKYRVFRKREQALAYLTQPAGGTEE